MDLPAVTVAGLLAMYCWDWVAMDGPAMAAMVAGSTVFKPVFTLANLVLVEAFILVTALDTMLVTMLSVTTEASTEAPVINFVAGSALIFLPKALAASA